MPIADVESQPMLDELLVLTVYFLAISIGTAIAPNAAAPIRPGITLADTPSRAVDELGSKTETGILDLLSLSVGG